MKSCPSCLFLIDDEQEMCETCTAEAQAATSAIKPLQIGSAASGGAAGLGTAVLERPAASGGYDEVVNLSYRSTKPVITPKAIVLLVVALLAAGAIGSAAGYGPLAGKFASWHLTFNKPEAFPQNWDHLDDLSTVFEVDLPGGSKSILEPLDPKDQSKGGIVGKTVTTVRGAKMQVAWSDFGVGATALPSFDSEDGIKELLARYASVRVAGEQTVVRPVMLPIGQAVDAVYTDGEVTTRVRMVMTPKEAFVLSTSGPDSDGEALDAAHQRLLKSFRPNL